MRNSQPYREAIRALKFVIEILGHRGVACTWQAQAASNLRTSATSLQHRPTFWRAFFVG
jgi:hypothetical protein